MMSKGAQKERIAAPKDKGSGAHTMNDMKSFQGIDKQYAIRIDNRAGADYAVSSGMLGAVTGNYGHG